MVLLGPEGCSLLYHYVVQIGSGEFVFAGPRWVVRTIYWYVTTNRGQSGLGWDRFPINFAKTTRKHVSNDV